MSKAQREYVPFTDDEIQLILEAKKFDDVKFVIGEKDFFHEVQKPFDENSNRIIIYKTFRHFQALFLHKNDDGVLDIFIFDSYGEVRGFGSKSANEIHKELSKDQSLEFNIFVSQNQRQGSQIGCCGFAFGDIEVLRKSPNIALQIIRDGLLCKKHKDEEEIQKNFTEFKVPPELMLVTQKLSLLESYIEDLKTRSIAKFRIQEFERNMEEFRIVRIVPASTINKVPTSLNLQDLFSASQEKNSSSSNSQELASCEEQKTIKIFEPAENKRSDNYLLGLMDIAAQAKLEKEQPKSKAKATSSHQVQLEVPLDQMR